MDSNEHIALENISSDCQNTAGSVSHKSFLKLRAGNFDIVAQQLHEILQGNLWSTIGSNQKVIRWNFTRERQYRNFEAVPLNKAKNGFDEISSSRRVFDVLSIWNLMTTAMMMMNRVADVAPKKCCKFLKH